MLVCQWLNLDFILYETNAHQRFSFWNTYLANRFYRSNNTSLEVFIMKIRPHHIKNLLKKYPELNAWFSTASPLYTKLKGCQQHKPKILADAQSRLLKDTKGVQAAYDWLVHKRKTKHCNTDSYTTKHDMERETGVYVTNGAFIAGALIAKYKLDPDSDKINLSKLDIPTLNKFNRAVAYANQQKIKLDKQTTRQLKIIQRERLK
jgi:hypothetical protein